MSYIAASYVKYIEGAGGRVVPIRINQSESYYNNIFNSINGLLIPGGSASIRSSGYSKAGSILYDLALEANNNGDYFPVWGTCLGFELLAYLAAGKRSYLTSCKSNDRALNLDFRPDADDSRLFGKAPKEVRDVLANEASTSNFHSWCLTETNFTISGLDNFLNILSTNLDDDNLAFISSFEARNYPIWGLQFHPEKNIYEWSNKYTSIPHSPEAIKVGQYFAEFFVEQARQNSHTFATLQEETESLIYNYQPIYTGAVSGSFLQCYFFD